MNVIRHDLELVKFGVREMVWDIDPTSKRLVSHRGLVHHFIPDFTEEALHVFAANGNVVPSWP
jgi:hypothetical protein